MKRLGQWRSRWRGADATGDWPEQLSFGSGVVALAAAAVILTAIDREIGSAGHLDPVAVHVALVKR